MAYARFGPDSAVYIYGDAQYLNCVSCRLLPSGTWYDTFYTNSRQAMIEHIQEHRQVGMKVPFHATRRLRRDIKKEGDLY